MLRVPLLAPALAALALVLLAASGGAAAPRSSSATGWTAIRAQDPARTIVRDRTGTWIATFTDGARSVTLAGPSRTFSEATTTSVVRTNVWTRLLPSPFAGRIDSDWLAAARSDRSPDVLATAMEYVTGTPQDASYGPLQADGTREEGSDWNDFLGVPAAYGAIVDPPEADQFRSLDCSGFVRMVLGRRLGLPISLEPDGGRSLPRRSAQQAAEAPGVVLAVSPRQVTSLGRLQPGDLVFFDAADDDGSAIDHVGLYVGLDSAGRRRFVSSRKSADGPTIGDVRGPSVLDGDGLYSRTLRALRRV